MNKNLTLTVFAVLALGLLTSFAGCAKEETPAPAAQAPVVVEAPAPVSDGSEDLKISFQLNLAEADVQNNYLSFAGNIRYMAVEKDQYDELTGASTLGSTHLFQSYLYDVEGKTTMPSGLRGLFLFGNNPWSQVVADNLNASKAADGTIMIQYAHRGTAYRITTDKSGNLTFPDGNFEMRTIGYIVGGGPQVISSDFSADGTAATVDWTKVWDSSIAGGKPIGDTDRKTGNIGKNLAAADSMYYFDGKLQTGLENEILTISGVLTAVGRR